MQVPIDISGFDTAIYAFCFLRRKVWTSGNISKTVNAERITELCSLNIISYYRISYIG